MPSAKSYRRHCFLPDMIANAFWLCFRLPSSLRMVDNLLAERGIVVSHQTVRTWAVKLRLFLRGRPGAAWPVNLATSGILNRSRSQ